LFRTPKAKAQRPPPYLTQTYNEFYAAMKDWGRYELAATPAEADLIYEVAFCSYGRSDEVYQGSGMAPQEPQVRLVISDPKTRVVL
jgi:hypothetical protein